MPAIPDNLILLWDGQGSLPAGWSALSVTGYLAAGESRGSGGAASHSHTAGSSHQHTQSTHTHQFAASPSDTEVQALLEDEFSGDQQIGDTHSHASAEATEVATGGTTGSATTSLASVTNSLRHCEVRLAKASGATSLTGLMGLAAADTLAGWAGFGEGGGPHASYNNAYLRAVSSSPSLSQQGSTTHSHTVANHHATHGSFNHGHEPGGPRTLTFEETEPAHVTSWGVSGATAGASPAAFHAHAAEHDEGQITAAAPALTSTTTGTSESIVNEALVDKYIARLFKALADSEPSVGLIGLWDTSDGDLPEGWAEISLTAANNAPYLKTSSSAATGESARTHAHTSFSVTHSHAINSHSHPLNLETDDVGVMLESGNNNYANGKHAVTLGNATGTVANHTDTTWTLVGSALPPFERFTLIVLEAEPPEPEPPPRRGIEAEGCVSVPKDLFRRMLAGSSAFRAQLGIEDPQAALEKIYLNRWIADPHAAEHCTQRPYAIVATEGGEGSMIAGGTQHYLRGSGSLWLYLCDRVRSGGGEVDVLLFENWVGAVLADIQAAAGYDTNLAAISWRFEVPPLYVHPLFAEAIGASQAWFECTLIVDWE